MQVKIVAIKRTPRVSKSSGKAFVSLGMKTEEHGEQWLSGFANSDNEEWALGSTVEIEVEKKGEYLNFKTPSIVKKGFAGSGGNPEIMNALLLKVIPTLERIEKELQAISGKVFMEETDDYSSSSSSR